MTRKLALALAMIGILALAPSIASACAACGNRAHVPQQQAMWGGPQMQAPMYTAAYNNYGGSACAPRVGYYAGQTVTCGNACVQPCRPACRPVCNPCQPRCGLFGSLGFGW